MNKKRIPIERIALGIILAAGVIPLIALAPGLGLVLKQFKVAERLSGKAYVPNVLSRLKSKGFIVVEGEGKKRYIKITERGRTYFNEKRLTLLHRPARRPWDGYWRVVIFDIPEQLRKMRGRLRAELTQVGFKKLQASVWVSPDECEEYVKLLKADRRIGKYLIYLKTKDIEYGASLRKLFSIERVS